MKSLVLVQCEEGRPVNGALCALQAVQAFGPMILVVCGNQAEHASGELASMTQVERVLSVDAADLPRAESMAPLLVEQQSRLGCTHIVATAGAWSRGVLSRAAAILDVMAISEVVKIEDEKTYVRPVHGGSALMTLRSEEPVQVLSVRGSAYHSASSGSGRAAPIERIIMPPMNVRSASSLGRSPSKPDGAVELIGARVVIAGGRGMGSAEGFNQLQPLAKLLGAAIGASRAAVDAGFAAADAQVGQSGKSVAPELYIAMGISGAVQHWAGMKDAKVIVAINRDAQAPIFEFADYGLVADVFEALPQLQESIAALPPRA